MWEIIGVLVVIALIVAAWVFIVPAAAFAGGVVAFVLGIIASYRGIFSGVTDTFVDYTPRMKNLYYDGKEPAKVSWFFGPCFSVFPLIFKHAFNMILTFTKAIATKWIALMDHGLLAKIFFAPIGAVLIGVTWVIGLGMSFLWAIVFSILFMLFLIIFYVFFAIFKFIDFIVLRTRGLKNHCPNCNELSYVPEFVCPSCGRIHKKLSPNKYGVFNHLCSCGAYLGATYFTGKSQLHSICPHCGEPFKTGATKPLTFQLIGGTSSGKTVYLAALMSEIHARSKRHEVGITLDPASRDNINELIRVARGKGDPAATQGRDVTFYAEVIDMGEGKTPLKLEIVDIPGEMFAGETALQEGLHKMSQYNYADGFVFIVDPFADGDLLNRQPNDGTQVSPISSEEVLTSFDQYLIAQGFAKGDKLINTPISIVVVKSDTAPVRENLTMEMIEEDFNANPGMYKNSFDLCRDQHVKELLTSLSMASLVSNIEGRFKNAHFFLSSAMGHAPQMGKPYEPVQIFETAEWMMKQANPDFHARLLGKKK